MNPVVVVDVETSGLDPKVDKILEIGWMVLDQGRPVRIVSSVTNPGPVTVTPEITEINGITQAMVDAAAPLEDLLARFFNAVEGKLIIGHNIFRFDWPFIANALLRQGPGPNAAWELRDCLVDTMAMFKGWKMGLKPQPGQTHAEFVGQVLEYRVSGLKTSVAACMAEFDISIDPQLMHGAAVDVLATGKIFEHLVRADVRLGEVRYPIGWQAISCVRGG